MNALTVASILGPAVLLMPVISLALAVAAGAPAARGLRVFLIERGPWLAFLVAAVATTGSLYYSEVAHFVPCELCWFQRIAMYPLSVILLVAAITHDTRVWRYVVPIAAIGLMFSTYHYQLESFPDQAGFCSSVVPCNVRYFAVYGFISLAFMAGAGFVSILALHLAMARARRFEQR